MPAAIDTNCDTWATVDFGRGPVEIRCTRTGAHATCEVHVAIMGERAAALPRGVERRWVTCARLPEPHRIDSHAGVDHLCTRPVYEEHAAAEHAQRLDPVKALLDELEAALVRARTAAGL